MAAVGVAAVQMLRKSKGGRATDHGGTSGRTLTQRWGDTIHGCMAELAVCRAVNRAWTPGGADVSRGEVGGRIEVRATEHQNGHLLVYPSDSDEAWFVLVIGHFPEFRIVGCIKAADAKRYPLNAQSKPPCHWVPQADLLPLSEAGQ
jgi:hypothetical protein